MHKTRISIIGSGNMADCLGHAFLKENFSITEVLSRNKKTGKKLAAALHAHFADSATKLKGDADIYFLCLPDDSLSHFISTFPFRDKILVHTSGSIPISVFGNQEHAGVFYPLQSLTKGIKTDFKNIPICIETSSPIAKQKLMQLGKALSKKTRILTSEERLQLHLAAVFANNFSNACFSMAEGILKNAGLPFSMLYELIAHTANKVQNHSPSEVQTGPAKRHDVKVLKKHEKLLKENPELLKVYKVMSNYLSKT